MIITIRNRIIIFRTGRVAFDAMGDRLFAEYKVKLSDDDYNLSDDDNCDYDYGDDDNHDHDYDENHDDDDGFR